MKKHLVLALVVAMIFLLAACSESKDVEMMDGDGFEAGADSDSGEAAGDSSAASDSAVDEVARVENGRLSAIEPPEGWLLGEAQSDDQLIYLFKHDLYDEYPQDAPEVTIDIDEDATPEEKIARTKELSEDWNEEYEIGEVTIGGIKFLTFDSQSQTFTGLFGIKDGVTLSISVHTRLEVDNADVIAIIESIRVAAE